MGILRLAFDDGVEIFDGLLVLKDHLVSLCPLVDVDRLCRPKVDATGVRENRLFEFLQPAVSEADVVENVRFVCVVRTRAQTSLQHLDRLAILLVSVVGYAKLVEDLCVILICLQRNLKLLNRLFVFPLVEIALRVIFKELHWEVVSFFLLSS